MLAVLLLFLPLLLLLLLLIFLLLLILLPILSLILLLLLLLLLPACRFHLRAVVTGIGHVRPLAQRAVVSYQRFVVTPGLGQRIAEVVLRIGAVEA